MFTINYIEGDATKPRGYGTKIIAHICNDSGRWGKGFVLALSRRWSEPEYEYRSWYANRPSTFKLGNIQCVKVEDDLFVANMIAQKGIQYKGSLPPIRYRAVHKCLSSLSAVASTLEASVHMPRIGCGLAGGTWSSIEPIIKETLLDNNIPTYVYDI